MTDIPRIGLAMVVDDEAVDLMLYERILKKSGLVDKVVSFSYPDKALEFLIQEDREEVDIIFLDVNMPRLNGFELLERATEALGEDFSTMVVVMLTTFLATHDIERAQRIEVIKDYLNKPLTVEMVQDVALMLAQHGKTGPSALPPYQTSAWSEQDGRRM